jgi:hypothetical protein
MKNQKRWLLAQVQLPRFTASGFSSGAKPELVCSGEFCAGPPFPYVRFNLAVSISEYSHSGFGFGGISLGLAETGVYLDHRKKQSVRKSV